MTELTQERLMLAGFRLLKKARIEGRYAIRYRDRSLFEVQGSDAWRTLASFEEKKDRDRFLAMELERDVWSVEIY